MLESEGVSYVPRPIGDDDPNDITSKMLGYTHEYNTEQQQYFKDHFGERNKSLGSPCCGGRTFSMDGSSCNYVSDNNFIGFKCFVNYYFLFINSDLIGYGLIKPVESTWMEKLNPLEIFSRFLLDK